MMSTTPNTMMTRVRKRNYPRKGEAQIPAWWMILTPHDVLTLGVEDWERRTTDEHMAKFYAQLAAEEAAKGLLWVDENGNLIDGEGGEGSAESDGRGSFKNMFGGRNFAPGSEGWDPKQWGIEASDPEFELYQSGDKLPPQFINAMTNYAKATGHFVEIDGSDFAAWERSRLRESSTSEGTYATDQHEQPAWMTMKLRGTKLGHAMRTGEYDDGPNRHLRDSSSITSWYSNMDSPEDSTVAATTISKEEKEEEQEQDEEHHQDEQAEEEADHDEEQRPEELEEQPPAAPAVHVEATPKISNKKQLQQDQVQQQESQPIGNTTTTDGVLESSSPATAAAPTTSSLTREEEGALSNEVERNDNHGQVVEELRRQDESEEQEEEKSASVLSHNHQEDELDDAKHTEIDLSENNSQEPPQVHAVVTPPIARSREASNQALGATTASTRVLQGQQPSSPSPPLKRKVDKEEKRLILYYSRLAQADDDAGMMCDASGNPVLVRSRLQPGTSRRYEANAVTPGLRLSDYSTGQPFRYSPKDQQGAVDVTCRTRSVERRRRALTPERSVRRERQQRSKSVGRQRLETKSSSRKGGGWFGRGRRAKQQEQEQPKEGGGDDQQSDVVSIASIEPQQPTAPQPSKMFGGLNYKPGSPGWDPRQWGIDANDPYYDAYRTGAMLPRLYVDAMKNYARATGKELSHLDPATKGASFPSSPSSSPVSPATRERKEDPEAGGRGETEEKPVRGIYGTMIHGRSTAALVVHSNHPPPPDVPHTTTKTDPDDEEGPEEEKVNTTPEPVVDANTPLGKETSASGEDPDDDGHQESDPTSTPTNPYHYDIDLFDLSKDIMAEPAFEFRDRENSDVFTWASRDDDDDSSVEKIGSAAKQRGKGFGNYEMKAALAHGGDDEDDLEHLFAVHQNKIVDENSIVFGSEDQQDKVVFRTMEDSVEEFFLEGVLQNLQSGEESVYFEDETVESEESSVKPVTTENTGNTTTATTTMAAEVGRAGVSPQREQRFGGSQKSSNSLVCSESMKKKTELVTRQWTPPRRIADFSNESVVPNETNTSQTATSSLANVQLQKSNLGSSSRNVDNVLTIPAEAKEKSNPQQLEAKNVAATAENKSHPAPIQLSAASTITGATPNDQSSAKQLRPVGTPGKSVSLDSVAEPQESPKPLRKGDVRAQSAGPRINGARTNAVVLKKTEKSLSGQQRLGEMEKGAVKAPAFANVKLRKSGNSIITNEEENLTAEKPLTPEEPREVASSDGTISLVKANGEAASSPTQDTELRPSSPAAKLGNEKISDYDQTPTTTNVKPRFKVNGGAPQVAKSLLDVKEDTSTAAAIATAKKSDQTRKVGSVSKGTNRARTQPVTSDDKAVTKKRAQSKLRPKQATVPPAQTADQPSSEDRSSSMTRSTISVVKPNQVKGTTTPQKPRLGKGSTPTPIRRTSARPEEVESISKDASTSTTRPVASVASSVKTRQERRFSERSTNSTPLTPTSPKRALAPSNLEQGNQKNQSSRGRALQEKSREKASPGTIPVTASTAKPGTTTLRKEKQLNGANPAEQHDVPSAVTDVVVASVFQTESTKRFPESPGESASTEPKPIKEGQEGKTKSESAVSSSQSQSSRATNQGGKKESQPLKSSVRTKGWPPNTTTAPGSGGHGSNAEPKPSTSQATKNSTSASKRSQPLARKPVKGTPTSPLEESASSGTSPVRQSMPQTVENKKTVHETGSESVSSPRPPVLPSAKGETERKKLKPSTLPRAGPAKGKSSPVARTKQECNAPSNEDLSSKPIKQQGNSIPAKSNAAEPTTSSLSHKPSNETKAPTDTSSSPSQQSTKQNAGNEKIVKEADSKTAIPPKPSPRGKVWPPAKPEAKEGKQPNAPTGLRMGTANKESSPVATKGTNASISSKTEVVPKAIQKEENFISRESPVAGHGSTPVRVEPSNESGKSSVERASPAKHSPAIHSPRQKVGTVEKNKEIAGTAHSPKPSPHGTAWPPSKPGIQGGKQLNTSARSLVGSPNLESNTIASKGNTSDSSQSGPVPKPIQLQEKSIPTNPSSMQHELSNEAKESTSTGSSPSQQSAKQNVGNEGEIKEADLKRPSSPRPPPRAWPPKSGAKEGEQLNAAKGARAGDQNKKSYPFPTKGNRSVSSNKTDPVPKPIARESIVAGHDPNSVKMIEPANEAGKSTAQAGHDSNSVKMIEPANEAGKSTAPSASPAKQSTEPNSGDTVEKAQEGDSETATSPKLFPRGPAWPPSKSEGQEGKQLNVSARWRPQNSKSNLVAAKRNETDSSPAISVKDDVGESTKPSTPQNPGTGNISVSSNKTDPVPKPVSRVSIVAGHDPNSVKMIEPANEAGKSTAPSASPAKQSTEPHSGDTAEKAQEGDSETANSPKLFPRGPAWPPSKSEGQEGKQLNVSARWRPQNSKSNLVAAKRNEIDSSPAISVKDDVGESTAASASPAKPSTPQNSGTEEKTNEADSAIVNSTNLSRGRVRSLSKPGGQEGKQLNASATSAAGPSNVKSNPISTPGNKAVSSTTDPVPKPIQQEKSIPRGNPAAKHDVASVMDELSNEGEQSTSTDASPAKQSTEHQSRTEEMINKAGSKTASSTATGASPAKQSMEQQSGTEEKITKADSKKASSTATGASPAKQSTEQQSGTEEIIKADSQSTSSPKPSPTGRAWPPSNPGGKEGKDEPSNMGEESTAANASPVKQSTEENSATEGRVEEAENETASSPKRSPHGRTWAPSKLGGKEEKKPSASARSVATPSNVKSNHITSKAGKGADSSAHPTPKPIQEREQSPVEQSTEQLSAAGVRVKEAETASSPKPSPLGRRWAPSKLSGKEENQPSALARSVARPPNVKSNHVTTKATEGADSSTYAMPKPVQHQEQAIHTENNVSGPDQRTVMDERANEAKVSISANVTPSQQSRDQSTGSEGKINEADSQSTSSPKPAPHGRAWPPSNPGGKEGKQLNTSTTSRTGPSYGKSNPVAMKAVASNTNPVPDPIQQQENSIPRESRVDGHDATSAKDEPSNGGEKSTNCNTSPATKQHSATEAKVEEVASEIASSPKSSPGGRAWTPSKLVGKEEKQPSAPRLGGVPPNRKSTPVTTKANKGVDSNKRVTPKTIQQPEQSIHTRNNASGPDQSSVKDEPSNEVGESIAANSDISQQSADRDIRNEEMINEVVSKSASVFKPSPRGRASPPSNRGGKEGKELNPSTPSPPNEKSNEGASSKPDRVPGAILQQENSIPKEIHVDSDQTSVKDGPSNEIGESTATSASPAKKSTELKSGTEEKVKETETAGSPKLSPRGRVWPQSKLGGKEERQPNTSTLSSIVPSSVKSIPWTTNEKKDIDSNAQVTPISIQQQEHTSHTDNNASGPGQSSVTDEPLNEAGESIAANTSPSRQSSGRSTGKEEMINKADSQSSSASKPSPRGRAWPPSQPEGKEENQLNASARTDPAAPNGKFNPVATKGTRSVSFKSDPVPKPMQQQKNSVATESRVVGHDQTAAKDEPLKSTSPRGRAWTPSKTGGNKDEQPARQQEESILKEGNVHDSETTKENEPTSILRSNVSNSSAHVPPKLPSEGAHQKGNNGVFQKASLRAGSPRKESESNRETLSYGQGSGHPVSSSPITTMTNGAKNQNAKKYGKTQQEKNDNEAGNETVKHQNDMPKETSNAAEPPQSTIQEAKANRPSRRASIKGPESGPSVATSKPREQKNDRTTGPVDKVDDNDEYEEVEIAEDDLTVHTMYTVEEEIVEEFVEVDDDGEGESEEEESIEEDDDYTEVAEEEMMVVEEMEVVHEEEEGEEEDDEEEDDDEEDDEEEVEEEEEVEGEEEDNEEDEEIEEEADDEYNENEEQDGEEYEEESTYTEVDCTVCTIETQSTS